MTYTKIQESGGDTRCEYPVEVAAWKIIQRLRDRKGFDAWWDEIGSENRDEIFDMIQDVIANEL